MTTETLPAAIEWLGTTYKTILTPEQSGGAMSLVDSWSPAGSGPPRHVHDREDEAFVILAGRYQVWMEGETIERGPGDAVFVPRGAEHTFRVIGDEPGHHIIILTPGGFEGFFEDMAKGGYRIPEDMGAVNESAQRHHLRFTGPPLADG